MLGAKVGVAFQDVAGRHSRLDGRLPSGQKRLDTLEHVFHPIGADRDTRAQQDVACDLDFVLKVTGILPSKLRLRRRRGVVGRKASGHGKHRGHVQAASPNDLIKHTLGGKAPHLHQIVHDPACSPQRQPAMRAKPQGDGAQIDVVSEALVEPDLFCAEMASLLERGEIEGWIEYGLFQLEDPVFGQEHPRHVGLDRLDRARLPGVGVRPRQEGDLRLERDRAALDGAGRRRHPSPAIGAASATPRRAPFPARSGAAHRAACRG